MLNLYFAWSYFILSLNELFHAMCGHLILSTIIFNELSTVIILLRNLICRYIIICDEVK